MEALYWLRFLCGQAATVLDYSLSLLSPPNQALTPLILVTTMGFRPQGLLGPPTQSPVSVTDDKINSVPSLQLNQWRLDVQFSK